MRRLLALAALSFCLPALAQTTPASPAASQGSAPTSAAVPNFVSPEVHSDGTVTLRYFAPGAKAVMATIEGNAKPMPLTAGAEGVWQVTTPPMQPEFYGYTFSVDGQRVLDPKNATVRPNLISPTTVLHVPAASPKPWELTDIPHGTVTHHWYLSKLAVKSDTDDGQRDLWVYTPPGYDPRRKEAYPVLYLNHGYSDAANGWVEAGQANLILDSLLHEGKIRPMVVVMPLGYGTKAILAAGWGRTAGLGPQNQKAFEDQLLHEVIPMAEAQYNIARDAAHRAIAGLSMGGGHSLYTGLHHPEVFQYVGAFSAGVTAPGLSPNTAAVDPAADASVFAAIWSAGATQQPIKLLWMSCGTEDSLITVNHRFEAWAKTSIKGNVQVRDTPGMHTWMVWRDDLIDFTPLLFR